MSGSQPIKFAEKYTLLDLIGVGGVAEVFRGKLTGDKGFEKLIVIKKLLAQHAADQEMVEIFIGEARLAALLQHENIAATYDFGEIGGEYFLAMEYLFGKNLHSVMAMAKQHHELFRLEHALAIASRICEGMDYAHNLRDLQNNPLNIVHRDLTPHNIFITYDGKVKILDFGVAKAEMFDNRTKEGVVKGKISYMSPERLSGEVIDARSDIFSIGIMLYEMISRQRMYQGDTADLIRKCLTVDYRNLADILPNLRPEVYAILDKALAVDLDQRYQSCARLQSDIEDLLFQMQLRIDARFLKSSIQALFRDEYAADQQQVSTVMQAQIDESPLQRREQTDITIPQERAVGSADQPEDKTLVLTAVDRLKNAGGALIADTRVLLRQRFECYRSALQDSPGARRAVLIAAVCLVGVVGIITFFMAGEQPVVVAPPAQLHQQPVARTPNNELPGSVAEQPPAASEASEVDKAAAAALPKTPRSPDVPAKPEHKPATAVGETGDRPGHRGAQSQSSGQEPQTETGTVISSEAQKLPVLKQQNNKKVKLIDSSQSQAVVAAPPVPGAESADQSDRLAPAEPLTPVVGRSPDMARQTLSFEPASPGGNKQREKIAALHRQAEAAMHDDRLLRPAQDSAYSYFQEILRLDPRDNVAAAGLRLIGDRYAALAEEALAGNRYGEAAGYVQAGLSVVPDYQRLLTVQKRVEEERLSYVETLSEKARQCLAVDKLTTPEEDSAYFYYNEIFRIDPENPMVREGFSDIADRYAALGDQAFQEFNYEMAEVYVERGLRIMPKHYYLLYLKDALTGSSLQRYGLSLKKNFNKLLSD